MEVPYQHNRPQSERRAPFPVRAVSLMMLRGDHLAQPCAGGKLTALVSELSAATCLRQSVSEGFDRR